MTAVALASARTTYVAVDWLELLDPSRPPRPWLVDGLLPEGASVAIVAAAKSGKSTLARMLALAVALDWQSVGGLPVRGSSRRVFYLDLENSEHDWSETLRAAGITLSDAAALTGRLVLARDQLRPLDTEAGGRELLAALTDYGIQAGDLVVLDSAQRIVEGKEDASDTWRAFHRATGKPLRDRGITVLRLDNTGKNESRGARGSSSKRDDVDLEWVLTRTAARVTLESTAARVPVPPLHAFRLEHVPGIGRRYLAAAAPPRERTDLEILETLDPPPRSQRDVKERVGWGSDRAATAIRAFHDAHPGRSPRSDTPCREQEEHSNPPLLDRAGALPEQQEQT